MMARHASQQQQAADQHYFGVRRIQNDNSNNSSSNQNSSWQASIPHIPTKAGSTYAYQSQPLPTAEAAAQHYDRVAIALLGTKNAIQGTNLSFSVDRYSSEDIQEVAQALLVQQPHTLIHEQSMPAAAAAAVAAAEAVESLPDQQDSKQVCAVSMDLDPDTDSGLSDGDEWYDRFLAAAAGAAIAARRAAAAAAAAATMAAQQQEFSRQQGLDDPESWGQEEEEQQQQQRMRRSRQHSQAVVKPQHTSRSLSTPTAAAAGAAAAATSASPTPAAAAAIGTLDPTTSKLLTSSSSSSWLQALLMCDYLFQPCDYCTGKRMERPKVGRDKLIRFFCPKDPSRGYCNYCPEIQQPSDSFISVRRATQNEDPNQYYIRLSDITKAAAAAAAPGAAGSSTGGSSRGVRIEDISGIQSYPVCGDRVVWLTPRQQRQQQQRRYKQGGFCVADGRHLKDSNCRYCSITCKLVTEMKESQGNGSGSRVGPEPELKTTLAAAAAAEAAAEQEGQLDDEIAAAAAVAAAAAAAAEPPHKKRRMVGSPAGDVSNDDRPILDLQQQQQGVDLEIVDATQQQQQHNADHDLAQTAMHLIMPSGNQVQVVRDAQGNTVVLHVPSPKAAAAAAVGGAVDEGAAVAEVDGVLPVVILQPAPEFLQQQ